MVEITSAESTNMKPQEQAPSTPTRAPPTAAVVVPQLPPPTTPVSRQRKVVSIKVWDVILFPPNNSFSGAVVPTFVNKHRRHRKLVVEINRVRNLAAASPLPAPPLAAANHNAAAATTSNEAPPLPKKETGYYEECVVRVMSKSRGKKKSRGANRRKSAPATGRPGKSAGSKDGSHSRDFSEGEDEEDDDDDDGSVASGTLRDTDSAPDAPQLAGWKPKYRIPVQNISIKSKHKSSMVITISASQGKKKQTRDLSFDDPMEMENFAETLIHEQRNEVARSQLKLDAALGGLRLKSGEVITFLVEIVSGWDLPIGDFTSSDPYVDCIMDQHVVHKTGFISKTRDPVWTLKTGSLFLLTVDSKKLFLSDGLVCKVKDYDKYGGNETLGIVTVPPKTLYEAKGERLEFKLMPANKTDSEVPGYLAVRCRRASEYDKHFMAEHKASSGKESAVTRALASAQDTAGGKGNFRELLQKTTKIDKDGSTLIKVRPGPDPKRKQETEWMSENEIEKETLKDSQHWVDAGSGTLGQVYIEVLGCDGLPNLDSGFAGNKTDTFVCVVFQDAVVRTDVINNCLSPRWLPWTQRAFIMRMIYSTSQLYVGIFDFDSGAFDSHDLIGRVAIDLSNFRKNTIYTLKYDIFSDSPITGRKSLGTITLRMRLEIKDDRKLLLTNLEPPPDLYVNVKKKRDFHVVAHTTRGKYNLGKYDWDVIKYYVEELTAYQHMLLFISDGVISLLMWRGHFPIKLRKDKPPVMLPLHSALAFVIFTTLVERPQLIPSFWFGSIAWLLIATMEYRRNNPLPWNRSKSFVELAEILILGKDSVLAAQGHSIAAYENYEEGKAFQSTWLKRIADAEAKAKRDYEESLKEQEEFEKEMEEIAETNTDISTKVGGNFSLDPLKPFLYPLQLKLGIAVRAVRFVKYVILWEECYFSFWVTVACSLLAIAFMFVPWFFIIRWSTRIAVWAIFGPWMKLVDIFYYSKLKPETEEEEKQRREEQRKQRRMQTEAAVREARIAREEAAKLRAMKQYMFGKFITSVPTLKVDRYRDVPLPESTAVPHQPERLPLSELAMREAGYRRTRLPGQHLVGEMIPQIVTQSFTDAPVGQATAQPDLLDRSGVGGGLGAAESTTAAYAKIASAVALAGVVTWFGVPLLSTVTQMFLKGLFTFSKSS